MSTKLRICLDEFLPAADRGKTRSGRPGLLDDLLPEPPKLDPIIYSEPLALELHVTETHCSCGESFIVPSDTFVEVEVKELRQAGNNFYYRAVGKVLIPLNSRNVKLLNIPHRTKTERKTVLFCQHCLSRADLYTQPETLEEWRSRLPKLLSKEWEAAAIYANPSRERLNELIKEIKLREEKKARLEREADLAEAARRIPLETGIQASTSCDPESGRD